MRIAIDANESFFERQNELVNNKRNSRPKRLSSTCEASQKGRVGIKTLGAPGLVFPGVHLRWQISKQHLHRAVLRLR